MVYKDVNKLADDMMDEIHNKYEAVKYNSDGQIDTSLSKFFDSEDDAVDFASNNDYDFVTGYTYKKGKDEPHSSFAVWGKMKGWEEY